jgi:predicted GNAT superfamily acetyltransferase
MPGEVPPENTTRTASAGEIIVRPLRDPGEFRAATALHRAVFQYSSEDVLPPRLLIAMRHNGGIVLGAFDADRLVGFTFSFLARDGEGPLYQYSQTAAVDPAYQDRGIGRALKLRQRDHARRGGVDLMRWAFDPMRSRNAHFNLDVLGASVGTLLPDLYGAEASGGATDRMIADWDLTGAVSPTPQPRPAARDWRVGASYGEPDGAVLIAVPAGWEGYAAAAGSATAAELRAQVRDAIGARFAAGLRAVSCQRVSDEVAVYRLTGGAA